MFQLVLFPPMKEKQESNYSDQNLNEMIFDCYDILVKKQEQNTKKTKLLFCDKNECFVFGKRFFHEMVPCIFRF